jgi:hypothetical protein
MSKYLDVETEDSDEEKKKKKAKPSAAKKSTGGGGGLMAMVSAHQAKAKAKDSTEDSTPAGKYEFIEPNYCLLLLHACVFVCFFFLELIFFLFLSIRLC